MAHFNLAIVIGGCAVLPISGYAAAQPRAEGEQACQTLAHTAFPDSTTVVISALIRTSVEGRALGSQSPSPVQTPEHCEVLAKLQERQGANGQTYAVGFRVRLPTPWNGRLFFEGGGGSDGVLGDTRGNLMGAQSGDALERGYAVVSQNAGHSNILNNDPKLQGVVTFGWDPIARRNYGGASIGPVVRAAKALVAARYGKPPAFTYFVGGSKGGQEAMMAAERFPEEFDAVLAGYPGFRLAYAGGVGQMWDAQAFGEAARAMGLIASDGLPLANKAMSDEDLLLVSQAVLNACDDMDGLEDGMVQNFADCTTSRVAPALQAITCTGAKTPKCLLRAQVAAMRKVFDGARGKNGAMLYSNWPWDPGIAARTVQGVSQGWRRWKLGSFAESANQSAAITLGGPSASAVFTSPPTPVSSDFAALSEYVVSVDIDRNAAMTRAKWGPFNESSADFMNADAVDLSRFSARGGKLIIYQGTADPVFSINDTISWVKDVNASAQGHAGRFLRLYAVPGMNHGGGGPATEQFAAFDALIAWREHGVAPGPLTATARATTPWPGRTRLLCPYPSYARYIAGDIEHSSSFKCVAKE